MAYSVLSVTDVGAADGDAFDDGVEDGGFKVGAGGETHHDDGALGTDVLWSN